MRHLHGGLSVYAEIREVKHVGVANLFDIDERNGSFGPIGIVVNPSDRGRGYAAAAYRRLGKYMFNERLNVGAGDGSTKNGT